jgi:hypothetical protein
MSPFAMVRQDSPAFPIMASAVTKSLGLAGHTMDSTSTAMRATALPIRKVDFGVAHQWARTLGSRAAQAKAALWLVTIKLASPAKSVRTLAVRDLSVRRFDLVRASVFAHAKEKV